MISTSLAETKMGSSDMGELKQSFVKLVRQVTAPQMPQFMIWLDVKLAEYKLNGYMRLGTFNDIYFTLCAFRRPMSVTQLNVTVLPITKSLQIFIV